MGSESLAERERGPWVFVNLETETVEEIGPDCWLIDVECLSEDDRRVLIEAEECGNHDVIAAGIVRRVGFSCLQAIDAREIVEECELGHLYVARNGALPSLEDAVRQYLDDARPAFPGALSLFEPTVAHVREGVERLLEGWTHSGEIPCGVDGCGYIMLDPERASFMLTFMPGLDVSAVCPYCVDHARHTGERFYWFGASEVGA